MLHFIGFKDEAYYRAIRVFGKPDFIHRQNDGRCREMIMPGDRAIYANGSEIPHKSIYSFDDSQEM